MVYVRNVGSSGRKRVILEHISTINIVVYGVMDVQIVKRRRV